TGGSTSGASTITQQLIKLNVLGNSSKSYTRKLDEAILAIGMTVNGQYSKQDILAMYLNTVGYGNENYGIEAAAENYFHLTPTDIDLSKGIDALDPFEKDFVNKQIDSGCLNKNKLPKSVSMSGAWQLQPWQALLLAGVPQNPNIHNPYHNPEDALGRM